MRVLLASEEIAVSPPVTVYSGFWAALRLVQIHGFRVTPALLCTGVTYPLTPSLPRVINFKSPLQPHQHYYITQNGWLGFSVASQMKDDYTTNSHHLTFTFLLRGWENVFCELGHENFIYKPRGCYETVRPPCPLAYRKIPKISPSECKPLKFETQKTLL